MISENNSQMTSVVFHQVDSWFFRESRPHGSAGANALSSVFPPPTRTLMGALRSHIGNSYFSKANNTNDKNQVDSKKNISWEDMDNLSELTNVIGNAEKLGSVQPRGVFLQHNEQCYLPAPINICHKTDIKKETDQYFAMQLSAEKYETDMGHRYLPSLPEQVDGLSDVRGAKPLDKSWLSTWAWEQVLAGKPQNLANDDQSVRSNSDFVTDEYRLGIQVNRKNRSVEQGILYQTTHLRLKEGVAIFMPLMYQQAELHNLVGDTLVNQTHLVRLGGEGRMAGLEFQSKSELSYLPQPPKQLTCKTVDDSSKKRFMIYLITKLAMQTEKDNQNKTEYDSQLNWLPKGFNKVSKGWQGKIRDIEVTLLSACMGKAHREGGWDQKQHKPRDINNYIPAGTALFVEVDSDISDEQLINNLHGQTFSTDDGSSDNEWGEGIMLVGQYF